MGRFKDWAQRIKNETVVLYFAARDPRTPWYAKALAGFVVAYALSPIDVIPDFIPVIGYLDDLLLVPLGLWMALKLIPPAVMDDSRLRAGEAPTLSESRTAAIVVVLIWISVTALTGWAIYWWV